MKSIYCLVTNDLNQDQRMHRICSAFAEMGYDVVLVGRKKSDSPSVLSMPFAQKRLHCWAQKGRLFYVEYNIRLCLFLLFAKIDIIYAVDLDTVAAAGIISKTRNKWLIFDAHEYFVETPELIGKPLIKSIWKMIEKVFVPLANKHLTVNASLADIFGKRSGIKYEYVYNCPSLYRKEYQIMEPYPYIVYQGVLNKGRGLEAMIEAMAHIPDIHLMIIGEGDLSKPLRAFAAKSAMKERIHFKGWMSPDDMKKYTAQATLGLNLLESSSLSYYYSLANKFFDYMHAEVPSVNMDFPEYRHIIQAHNIGILLPSLDPAEIATRINQVLLPATLDDMKAQCAIAKINFQWDIEKQKLINLLPR